jgi:PAS domain S-box-containing protein
VIPGRANALKDLVWSTGAQLNGLFGAMVDALPVASYITDAEGRLKYFNPAAVKLSGRVPEIGTDQWCVTWKLFWPDGTPLPHDQCPMAVALKGGEAPGGIECIAERPDGTRFWFTPYPVILRDAEQRIIGGMNLLVEITDRKNAESEAIEALKQLRLITDNMEVGVTQCTSDLRYLWASRSLAAWLGRTPEEIAGCPILDVIGQEGYESILPHIQRVLSGVREEFEAEVKYRGVGVRRIHAVYVPTRGQDHNVDGWIAVIQDVTARHAAEEARRRSEARWNATIENLEAGVVIATDTEQVIYRNRAALRMHGFTADQRGLGPLQEMSNIFQLRTLDGRLLTLDEWPMRRIKRGEMMNRLELRLRRPDQGWEKIISYSGALVESAIGERLMFVSAQDVTDQRKAEQALRESEKLESLGTLASGIAHDFNNLLGAVLAQAELAAAGLAAGSYPVEELETIREVAIRGSDIVRQLMIYAGKEGDVFEFIDISNTVREIYGLLKSSISKRAELVTDLSEHLPPIKARPAQLRQVLMNLVVNASDAIGGRDGVIRVTTKTITLGPNSAGITTKDLTEGDYIQLEVSDTGGGMSHEIRARIFDPFFSTKSAGRGLGLPVIHGIVQGLHGAISVESEVGKGTTFQILIPSAGAGTRLTCDAIAGKEQEVHRSSEGTVLLVEDEAQLRSAVKKMLGKAGFTVFDAGDGSEAIELLRSKAAGIDLLILDISLPGRSSHEVLREAVDRWPQIKVVLASAYDEEMAKASLTASQVRGFVRKPYQVSTLLSTIRNALSS